jgi:Calcineurin-like phosphoesterase
MNSHHSIKTILAFGDVHGKHLTLKRLLSHFKKRYDFERPDFCLVGLGDYIDRDESGSSHETLRLLLQLKTKFNCIFLKGNHEHHLITEGRSMDDDCDLRYPLTFELRKLLEGMPLFCESEHFFFVHGSPPRQEASLLADTPPTEEMLWSYSPRVKKFKDKRVVVGHSVVATLDTSRDLIYLDTGAGAGGSLSGILLDDQSGECLAQKSLATIPTRSRAQF